MPISLNGSSGITTPGITNTGSQAVVDLTTSGNTIIGDASTDTLNVGNGGLVKNASGNVGIGLSNPSAKLEVNPAADSYFTGGLRVNRSNDGQQYGTVTCDGNLVLTSVETAIGAPVIAFRTSTNGTTSTERARIDSSGNLGLGVTPSAWGGNTRAYDLQYYNTFSGGDDSSRAYMLLGSNFYEAAAGTQRYKVTNANIPATMYKQRDGVHSWYYAPNGTAGNTISFTQAMTLNASGQLAVGATGPLLASTYIGKFSVVTAGGANVAVGGGSDTTNTVMSRIVGVNQNNGNTGNDEANEFQGITSIETALVTSNSNVSGNSGGYLMFKTKADAGALTERLRIASTGAFGLSGANYGTNGQVLTSGGSGAAPTWTTVSGGGGNTPGFGTNKLGSVSVVHNTLTEVTTWTEAWDSDNAFASGRFTPQTAGYYFVSNQAIGNYSGTGTNIANFEIRIYKNSTVVATAGSSNENTGMINYLPHTNSVIVYLNGTTDYVSTSVYFYTYNSITPCTFSELTFQAFKVGT